MKLKRRYFIQKCKLRIFKEKRKLCLKNINLDIKSGETVGIIGGTGSSKSSLVQLIPRLYDTTDGEGLSVTET